MWFIASIAAFSAAYMYNKAEKSSAEIAIACVAVALVGIALALIAAPWPVHLLMLAAALVSNRSSISSLFSNR